MWLVWVLQYKEFQQFLYTNELAKRLAFLCRQNAIVYRDWLRDARVDYFLFCDLQVDQVVAEIWGKRIKTKDEKNIHRCR